MKETPFLGLPGESKPFRVEPVVWPPQQVPERAPEQPAPSPEKTPEPTPEKTPAEPVPA